MDLNHGNLSTLKFFFSQKLNILLILEVFANCFTKAQSFF
jgi:hypothetical protein